MLPEYFSSVKKKLRELNKSDGELPAPDSRLMTFVAGGTDLYVQKHDAMIDAQSRFVFDHQELNGISKKGNKIFIGP